jgi:2-polyprenyl-3-methyl-5-hydroxy-6-metoxy-1,4-benzoquinol methylase
MNKNIMTFDEWVILGKDEGMERGHHNSVEHMFNMILDEEYKNYSVMDIGCGNGWVVRKFQEHSLCKEAHGLDGANHMIKKARTNDSHGTYFNENIETWSPIQKYDIIFSMETLYYFKTPQKIINKIYQDALHNNGMFIMGIDHYTENVESLDWGNKFNLDITTLSIHEWVNLFEIVGFKNIAHKQVEAKNLWEGTLIIKGIK